MCINRLSINNKVKLSEIQERNNFSQIFFLFITLFVDIVTKAVCDLEHFNILNQEKLGQLVLPIIVVTSFVIAITPTIIAATSIYK